MKETSSSSFNGRLRRLSSEEIDLWVAVTRSVAPLPNRAPVPAAKTAPKACPTPKACPASKSGDGPPPLAGAAARPASAPLTPSVPAPAFAPLERRLRQKLARGRASPDAVIDLHGLRSREACVALRRFLSKAQLEGAKLVLVVTGKGERDGAEDQTPGVLRRSVPHWLRGAEYHAIVVGFEEASRPHGGAGALYVRLRRLDRVRPR